MGKRTLDAVQSAGIRAKWDERMLEHNLAVWNTIDIAYLSQVNANAGIRT